MIGFLVRAAIGGAVAYGVLNVLEKTKAVEKATTAITGFVDDLAARFMEEEAAAEQAHKAAQEMRGSGY